MLEAVVLALFDTVEDCDIAALLVDVRIVEVAGTVEWIVIHVVRTELELDWIDGVEECVVDTPVMDVCPLEVAGIVE